MNTHNRLLAAFAVAILFIGGFPLNASSEEQAIEEIVVTGSAISRKDLDTALPVTVLTAEDIAVTGVSNVNELIEDLPSMQNMTVAADSVGGGGGGVRTANLRGIGEQYTLSLLNGRRMAPADSGSVIDLSNIPIAAIERVEILKDGASALYGSDAIAGVLNFILRDSYEGISVSGRMDEPQEDGGASWNVDLVAGYGDMDVDGYSLVFSYSREDQDQLAGVDRSFSESGFVNFSHGGQDYYFENSSANAIPGNAFVYDADFGFIRGFNPDRAQNGGTCPPQTTPSREYCRFDYTSTLETVPEHERDSLFLNGTFNITETMTGFATVLYSQYEQVNRIAPYPTGEVPLPFDSELVRTEVLPHLTAEESATAARVHGAWRALPGGNRTIQYEIDSLNFTAGIEGYWDSITYEAALTRANTTNTQSYPTGWLIRDTFVDLVSSGQINIFANQDEFQDADALAPAVYSGEWDEVDSTMTALDAVASMPIFQLDGGEAVLAVGAEYRTTSYERSLADANTNEILLFLSSDTPYELERDQYGLFTEILVPVLSNLELGASLRYDNIDAVSDELNGNSIGEGDDDVTYKLTAMFDATDWMTFRGSFGTGFKAPSMREIGEPLSEFGVTSGDYACPFAAGDPLADFCLTDDAQYNVFRQGYAELQFESSEQWTFGVVLTPWEDFDLTIDYWSIELEDLVERLTEQQIFNDPVTYRNLFTSKTNLATGQEILAIIQAAVNVGTKENKGVDFAVNKGFDLDWGYLNLSAAGTYMDTSESSLTGSSLGRFGNDDAVVFEWQNIYSATLTHGAFTHHLSINYQSGYDDQEQTVEQLGTGVPLGAGPAVKLQLEVDEQYLIDYQFRYLLMNEKLNLVVGVNNLTDESPPLSLRDSGAGHQVGWDPRYSDPYGRTFYLGVDFKM